MVPGKTAALRLFLTNDAVQGIEKSKITSVFTGIDATSCANICGIERNRYGNVAPAADAKIDFRNNYGISELSNSPYQYGTYAEGNSGIAVTLERSDLFNLSGVPINNARVLAVRANYTNAEDRHFTTFLKFVRLARIFLNNVEVEQ